MNYLRRYLQGIIYRLIQWHYRKARILHRRGMRFVLRPTVFHPGLYLSTDILLDFTLNFDLRKKNVLELGCGSGMISLYLAKHTKAKVYASDININAVEGLQYNATEQDLNVTVFHSDLFDTLPDIQFDFILVNPPFFKKTVSSVDEFAFYCGPEYEYFKKFFTQIKNALLSNGKVIIILSENADISEITAIAETNGVNLTIISKKKKWMEWFFIYELSLIP